MSEWAKVRDAFGFQSVDQLLIGYDGCLRWDEKLPLGYVSGVPSTYVMVLQPSSDEPETILYVGMAGKGWAVRAKQHNGGLKRVHKGMVKNAIWQQHYDDRIAWLQAGSKITVYERVADKRNVFGHEVSDQHAEEQALIKMLTPKHNRLGVRKAAT